MRPLHREKLGPEDSGACSKPTSASYGFLIFDSRKGFGTQTPYQSCPGPAGGLGSAEAQSGRLEIGPGFKLQVSSHKPSHFYQQILSDIILFLLSSLSLRVQSYMCWNA